MKTEDLRAICELTYKLTELRLKECPQLVIENFAPDLFQDLLTRWTLRETGIGAMRCDDGTMMRMKL